MLVALREASASLLHDRRFTAAAVALLALAIGALIAVYAIVHAVVIRPLPFRDQDRVAVAWQRDDRRVLPVIEVAHGEMEDWRTRSRAVEHLAVFGSVNWNLTLADQPTPDSIPVSAVSPSFFAVIGTPPLIGRGLEAADESGALPRAMVISHGLWLRRFGGAQNVVGRPVPVKLDADGPTTPVEIAGVMPREFDFPRPADAWLPAAPLIRHYSVAFGGEAIAMQRLRVFYILAKVKPGVGVEAAARDLSAVMRTAGGTGGREPSEAIVVTPIDDYLLGPAGPVLWTLLGGALLMLAIACANVAGLHVSRSARRQRALAVRAALGASHRHLVAGALLESALITLIAVTAALGVAAAVQRAVLAIAPAGVPRIERVALLDTPVVLASGAAILCTLLLCAMWPALVAARVDAVAVLVRGTNAAAAPHRRRLQRIVVAAQVAIAVVLLAGTALFVRTVKGLDRTVLGFDPDRLLAISISPATGDVARWNAFYDAVMTRVEAMPGVVAAGAVSRRPLSGPIGWDSQPIFPGQAQQEPATWTLNPHTNQEIVSPGYFNAMGIRLRRGRLFTPADTTTTPGVVVVSESAARRLWPGRDALGQRLRDPSYRADATDRDSRWQTVVGVVNDVRYRGLNDVRLDLYLPATQSTNRVQQLMVRTHGNPADAVAAIRAAAREIDPNAEIGEADLMSDVVDAASAPWRFLMRVFVAFAGFAAVLAIVGLGAVVALAVTVRRRELAIRAALGAGRGHLQAAVLGEALLLVGAGLIFGFVCASALGRSVAHVLVGVSPHDPLALGAAAVASAGAGLLAAWLPARRASAVDPNEALRAE